MSNPNQLQLPRATRNGRSPSFPDFRILASASEPPSTEEHRRVGPRRVASYLSLTSRTSFSPEPITPLTSGASNTSLLVRERDKVWHNPNLDQMVEALQVGIMERGAITPIPIDHNAYVIALIEAFAKDQKRIKDIEAEFLASRESHERDEADFKKVADEWIKCEAQYKAEVKRLEVLLSRASIQGLEAVTLARANSVLNRDGPGAKEFVSDVKRLSAETKDKSPERQWGTAKGLGRWDPSVFSSRQPIDELPELPRQARQKQQQLTRQNSAPKPPLPRILDNENDYLMSEKIRKAEAAERAAAAAATAKLPNPRVTPEAKVKREDSDFSPFSFERDGGSSPSLRGS